MALKVLASMTTAAWSRRAAPTMARLAALPAWQRRCYSSEGINVGDTIPSTTVFESNPGNSFELSSLFAGKKGILFGVPGAFTPTCHNSHLPSYLAKFDELKGKGVEVIACISVNDAFVMDSWGKDTKADGKIRMVADPDGSASKAMGLLSDAFAGPLGNPRCKRFSMLVEDNVIKMVNLEEADGLACTLGDKILESL
eukprot:m.18258 g.18258  ORF g.18258 m.18258 type:complete len:198 (-) comp10778_c0_seq4:74-667(-)